MQGRPSTKASSMKRNRVFVELKGSQVDWVRESKGARTGRVTERQVLLGNFQGPDRPELTGLPWADTGHSQGLLCVLTDHSGLPVGKGREWGERSPPACCCAEQGWWRPQDSAGGVDGLDTFWTDGPSTCFRALCSLSISSGSFLFLQGLDPSCP